jgi:hypothetical protein
MNRVLQWAGPGACVLFTGCASVTGGNVQKMYVQTVSLDGATVSGAECALSNDKGTWRLNSPGDTSVVRSNKPMEVKCTKPPLPQGLLSLESGTRPAMFGNILIGGVVGAVIDHNSGAAYEYPEAVKVIMGQMSSLAFVRTAPGVPPPSGFAGLYDADAVPYLSAKGREAYRTWAARPNPKAFGVAPNGSYFTAAGTLPQDRSLPTDPTERAMVGCERAAKMPCKLYAVNDNVVWVREAAARPAPVAAASSVPVVANAIASPQPAPIGKPQPAPIATGYARVDDVDAVPYLGDKARENYREWIGRPTPKAFAISTAGHSFGAWSLKPIDPTHPIDPSERALFVCAQRAHMPCKLYAVNGSVVWMKEGASAILPAQPEPVSYTPPPVR